MKLATLKDGTRDGTLVVVSTDLTTCTPAEGVAPTLQSALDNWGECEPQLSAIAIELEKGQSVSRPFASSDVESPLPRAYQWADGSAYVNHVELVRKARGVDMPESFWTDPLMYQGGSDSFIAPCDPISIADESWGIDMEAEVAVIVDDVPMGCAVADAGHHIRLIMLVNDVSLRGLIPGELAKGFGFFHGKPSSAFSPVALTPSELGEAWQDYKVHLPMLVTYNGEAFGKANAGIDMTFNFAQLVAHAARSRPLAAGTIVGSGTISNKLDGGAGKTIANGGVGYSCIAEIRTIETINEGKPSTPFMSFGDTVQISMQDKAGNNLFGTIDQQVIQYTNPGSS